jgi:predicted GIY-YIG superfamily endonuclease
MPRRSEAEAGGRVKYVYMLRSIPFPERYYIGCSADLRTRLAEHNKGHSPHTKKFLPWSLVGYIAFSDHGKADRFEAYLKTASGRTFAKRHF